jgi:hypothetical protein
MVQQFALFERGLRPAQELAENRPHGDRIRYMGGCRCQACRSANTAYERRRAVARAAGEWNGLVSARAAQEHLSKLSKEGVGRRAVGDVCGVADTILSLIISGRKSQIRASTERAILSVTAQAKADHALIPAGPTWQLIDELLADGYTKGFLAKSLGRKRAALQLQKTQVTVRNAYEVSRLYERLRKVDAAPSWQLIAQLRAEGYLTTVIENKIRELAQLRGIAFDGLEQSAHRIRANVAKLIQLAHLQMTE